MAAALGAARIGDVGEAVGPGAQLVGAQQPAGALMSVTGIEHRPRQPGVGFAYQGPQADALRRLSPTYCQLAAR